MTLLRTAGRMALDLLYPPRCAVCGSDGTFLCDGCLADLPRAEGARCDVCWSPKSPCDCTYLDFAFTCLRSAFQYDGEIRHLVRRFKFAGLSAFAPGLAIPMHETYRSFDLRADVIVSVPMTGLGKRLRGYNQAALLAEELSKLSGVPYAGALSRVRSVKEQARSATAEERRRNVAGAFAVRRANAVKGKSVLLVDDVATTGATLNSCAVELLAAGAASVNALTLARED